VNGKNKDINALNVHFAQWQESARRIREQFASVIKQQKALQKSLHPILDAQKNLQKSLEPFLASQRRLKEITDSIRIPKLPFAEIAEIAKSTIEFQKQIRDLISPTFDQLQKSFNELPSRTQEALLKLGDHGWFFDLEMPLPGLWRLKEALSEGNVVEAENALVEYFSSRLDEIENSIVGKFPHREKMIRAAFRAHKSEEYELSIPVFLAQTDGICNDVIEQYLFMKQNRKPRTAIYVERIASDTYRAALLQPLAQALPIGASKHERNEDFNELNRHMVLHGESLDYGTKVNGLKAISLINYVTQVLTLEP
jgi:hypothetical protein